MRLLTLPEYGTCVGEPLGLPVASALATTRLVDVAGTLEGRTRLTATSYVGVVRVGSGDAGVEVRVRPKVGVHRLLWLLGYARNPRGWREDWTVGLTEEPDLVPAMAIAFTAAASRAFAAGVLQGYRVVEEPLPVLRGRLREADQLRTRLGLAVPLEVRFDDYTVDIPENRILLAAALRLRRLPRIPPGTRRALHRIITALADITPLVSGRQLPDTPVNRLTQRYQPALRLARLVLAGRSVEQPPGPVEATGFVFDLNKVFEDWLTAALREAVERRYGGHVRAQQVVHLDEGRQLPMRPDITWWAGQRCLAVVDAKYKTLDSGVPPQADIYQMLAYCTVLGLGSGHLVYAAGEDRPVQCRVVRAGVTVSSYAIDLSASVERLLMQVEDLANHICGHVAQAGEP